MHIIYIRKKKLSFSPNHVAVSMGPGTNPGALSENTVVSFWPKALMKTHVEKQKEHKNAKISATATATATATVITVTTPGRRARAPPLLLCASPLSIMPDQSVLNKTPKKNFCLHLAEPRSDRLKSSLQQICKFH